MTDAENRTDPEALQGYNDNAVDALAAVAIMFIVICTALFWLSGH